MTRLSTLLFATILTVVFATAFAETENNNNYVQTNFVSNDSQYSPALGVDEKFINAWGIAIRPAGAGGHFWVVAKNISYEYIGDVHNSSDEKLRKLHQDDLKIVKFPVGGQESFGTGVVFNDSKENFVITQQMKNVEAITGPAKFIFASDGGIISAWTERKKADGTFDRPGEALKIIDQSAEGAQFFGLAISHDYRLLYVADFGNAPAIKVFDGDFQPVAVKFDMPFDENKNGKVDAGEYAPFNIQALKTPAGENHIFVTYAKTRSCPAEEVKNGACKEGGLFVGEEGTSKPGYGRIAEFTEKGKLVAMWNDGGHLSAPWGIAFAPKDFGTLSGKLLVANFGDGTIASFDPATRDFVDYVKKPDGNPVVIDKIWGILFGNGASLGDTTALYFTAGPDDEKDGIFGSLRLAKE